MSRNLRLILAVAAAAAVMAASGIASAAEFTVEPAGSIAADSLGRMDFQDSTFGIGPECFVNLAGSLHEGPITKMEGALIGYITRAAQPSECINGNARIFEESLPWHISYESISGILPEDVTGVRILLRDVQFLITAREPFGTTLECEYRGNALGILSVTRTGPGTYATGLIRSDENWDIPLINQQLNDGFNSCPDEGVLIGELELEPGQTLIRS